MKIISTTSGEILQAIRDRHFNDTILTINAPYVVLSFDEDVNKEVAKDLIRMGWEENEEPTYSISFDGTQLLKDGVPVVLESNPFSQAVRDAYVQAIVDLDQIQSANLDTNAKLQLAVKGMSEIIEKLLKFIKNRMID